MPNKIYKKIICVGCFIFYCGSAFGDYSLSLKKYLNEQYITSTIKDINFIIGITAPRILFAEKNNSVFYRDLDKGIKEAEALSKKSLNISMAKIKLMKKNSTYYSCNYFSVSSYVSFIAADFKKIKSCKMNSCSKENYELINRTLYSKLTRLVEIMTPCMTSIKGKG